MYEQKPNTGAAFQNDKKGNSKAPDWKGKVNIDGVEKEIALWERQGQKGKFFSIALSEPYKKNHLPDNINSKTDLPF